MPALKWAADFETTTDLNDCRVWAFSACEIGNPANFVYGTSIQDFMKWVEGQKSNPKLWFHNAKFDSQFIMAYLFQNGFTYVEDKKDADDYTFTTLIGDTGAFYQMEIFFKYQRKVGKSGRKYNRVKKVTIYDSLKILNFSVAQIAKDFDLPIQKLELDYETYREEGHELTKHEIDYIRNDVEIMARALDFMFTNNMNKMTAASNAMGYFKKECCPKFKFLFPTLEKSLDDLIRRSYKGGFTYLNPLYAEKETGAGVVLDINSAYPAAMHCMYSKMLPYGQPLEFQGKYKEDIFYPLYIQEIVCSFELKKGKIPSIQLKHSFGFLPNQYIESSNGEMITLTLTSVDLELFLQQYNVFDLHYIRGWKFQAKSGIFDEYVDHFMAGKIKYKKEGNKAMTLIQKLQLNSLYGKFATSVSGTCKKPYLDEDGVVRYEMYEGKERKPVYTAMAAFITSLVRQFIINSSQYIRDWSLRNKGYDAYVYS